MSEVTTNLKSQNETRKALIRKIALTGVMTALAEVLMMLEVPLPLMPGFLKYDFSDIPALFAGFACGPVAGVIVELLKNLLHFIFGMSSTEGIGEVANFISGTFFVLAATIVYQRLKNTKGVILSLVFGTAALTIATSFVNYFFSIPLYEKVCGFPLPAIIASCDEANFLFSIKTKLDVILMTFVPFNIFKGITISIIAYFCYLPLRKFFEEKKDQAEEAKPAVSEEE